MTILIGDVRMAMEEGLRNTIELILNTKKHLREYWILVHAKQECDSVMASKVVILPYEPPRMLGTVCYYINNRIGYYRQLWVLPLDMPVRIELEKPNEAVWNSSQGMPIIH